jgi:hypothetical protein
MRMETCNHTYKVVKVRPAQVRVSVVAVHGIDKGQEVCVHEE